MLCRLMSAIVVLALLTSLYGQDARSSKHVVLPSGRLFGHYSVIPKGRPRRPTYKEDVEDRRVGRIDAKLQQGELRGKVEYPQGAGLGIGIADNEHGTAVEHLKAIQVIDPRDIHWVSI